MSLTKRELEETQMIITTPEKWDVITRKLQTRRWRGLRLLIIDEDLLADERAPSSRHSCRAPCGWWRCRSR